MLWYFLAAAAVFIVKVYYRTADSDALKWILAPTTWWVRTLSGISFEYTAPMGYISHAYRFIIAPSCSGVRFLLLVFVMTIISFTDRMDSFWKKGAWFLFSVFFSYVSTIFINGIRITVSIYLPLSLTRHNLMAGWLTSKRLHTIIGTAIYFCSLFLIYYLAGKLCSCFAGKAKKEEQKRMWPLLAPLFWYFMMVLGLPFAGRMYQNQWEGFGQYTLLVSGVCAVVVCLIYLAGKIYRCGSNIVAVKQNDELPHTMHRKSSKIAFWRRHNL